ncbi:MAG: hypothetical protein SGI89_13635 [bacterium]|nr:hypothetical protein [bacterium]
MSVRSKFNEFKKEIRDSYEKDTFGMLEMSGRCTGELVSAGYFHRRIESFFFINEFSATEINKFFTEESSGVEGVLLGEYSYKSPEETIYEFVLVQRKEEFCKYFYGVI